MEPWQDVRAPLASEAIFSGLPVTPLLRELLYELPVVVVLLRFVIIWIFLPGCVITFITCKNSFGRDVRKVSRSSVVW